MGEPIVDLLEGILPPLLVGDVVAEGRLLVKLSKRVRGSLEANFQAIHMDISTVDTWTLLGRGIHADTCVLGPHWHLHTSISITRVPLIVHQSEGCAPLTCLMLHLEPLILDLISWKKAAGTIHIAHMLIGSIRNMTLELAERTALTKLTRLHPLVLLT